MARRNTKKDETLVDIVEVKEQAQDYYSTNQTKIIGIAALVLGVLAAIMLYRSLIRAPKVANAMEAMTEAQFQFERDSFAQALRPSDPNKYGFLRIIEDYSGTPSSNLAHFYAGISYLHLDEYSAAISYLEDFSPSGELTPSMKYSALGDAYSESNDMSAAASNYEKAVSSSDIESLTAYHLEKLGRFYQSQNNMDAAAKAFQRIKDEFPNSAQATEVEKLLGKVGVN